MEYLQYDIFGNLVKPEDTQNNSRKFKRMQEIYGIREDKVCKTCKHCLSIDYHNKVYHKCDLWRISNCAATDIRLKDKACNRWEVEV